MKLSVIIIVTLLFLTHFISTTLGNPFSSKNGDLSSTSRAQSVSDFVYKGYLFIKNVQHAIVEINGEQQVLKVGDRAGGNTIIEIDKEYLGYRVNGKEYKILMTD